MYIEDIFLVICEQLARSPTAFDGRLASDWHISFAHSVAERIRANRPLSVNQCKIVAQMIQKVRDHLVNNDLDDHRMGVALSSQHYRLPPYKTVVMPREVRYLGNNLLGFRCKSDTILIEQIKRLGGDERDSRTWRSDPDVSLWIRPRFDRIYKIWIVPVNRVNLTAINSLIQLQRFDIDPATQDYLTLCEQSIDQPSIFLLAEEGVLVATVRDNDCLAGWLTTIAGGIVL